MSKWKCEICNSEFDNFQAQGFNNKIYCPLCYYKELYKTTELERERLNNIINELENFIKNYSIPEFTLKEPHIEFMETKIILDKLKELKNKYVLYERRMEIY